MTTDIQYKKEIQEKKKVYEEKKVDLISNLCFEETDKKIKRKSTDEKILNDLYN